MAQQLGRATPEELARELRVVVKVGARASRLVYRLDQLPGLCQLSGKDPVDEKWDCAIAVVALVKQAVAELGEGPYGQAAQALFGFHPAVLGLPLGRRRAFAADCLDASTATFARWWQPQLILNAATEAYDSSSQRPTTSEN